MFVRTKLCLKFARSNAKNYLNFRVILLEKVLAYGVIGNTAGFGPVVLFLS